MAYITTEDVKEIRNNMKKEYPSKDGWKFSITKQDNMQVCVVVLEAPYAMTSEPRGYESVNHFWIEDHYKDSEKVRDDLLMILGIMSKKYWDKSDCKSDYHNCAYYRSLAIGSYDKPFKVNKK